MSRLIALFFILASASALAQSAALKSPNVSANALFLYQNSNFHNDGTDTDNRNGIDLQEAELAFYSDVDSYSRLAVLLTVHPEYKANSSGGVDQTWAIEPEELYADSSAVDGVGLKVGIFKGAFGKHAQLHTHAFPFVLPPVVVSKLLGDDGLSDVGISVAKLLPTPWFSELSLQYLRGKSKNTEFNSTSPNSGVELAHWKNLIDLSDDSTIEAGASFATGANSVEGHTDLYGLDLTYKWRPAVGGKYHAVIVGAELISRRLAQPGVTLEKGDGGYIFGGYQFAEQWQALARYDQLTVADANATVNPDLESLTTRRYSASVVFTATEFSSFRLEYDQTRGPHRGHGSDDDVEHAAFLQANFTIGAHPAHAY
jgi:hypothetical protein